MTRQEFEEFAQRTSPWYQTMVVEGVTVPGRHRMHRQTWILPDDMTGLRSCDLGCGPGFFVFEAEKRGAEAWGVDGDMKEIEKAEAVKAFARRTACFAHWKIMNLRTWPEWRKGFDVVTMLSVFHHLQHPLTALRTIRAGVHGQFIAEIPCYSAERLRWKPLTSIPEPLGSKTWTKQWYPTREAVLTALGALYSRVQVLGANKTPERLVFLCEV